jgi:hypothetical protein
MMHCDSTHTQWLRDVKADEACWEYRYRYQSLRDDKFYSRLHASLCYRYASVAVCIGRHNADEIVSVFPTRMASDILLHLHILFDHVMCHGLGSDFVVRPDTPDGADFKSTKRAGITRAHELSVTDDLTVLLPQEDHEYVGSLLREEHFLRDVDFSLLSMESLPAIQDQLSRQFADFRTKVATMAKGKILVERSVQITVYILSAVAVFNSAIGAPLGAAASAVGTLAIPKLAELVADTLQKIHRNKLASYAINPQGKGS